MKRMILALFLVLLLAGSASALSNKEYKQLKKDSALFAGADRKLTEVWNRIKGEITRPAESAFEILKAEQLDWIKSGRDKAAKKHMKKGASKDVAYANATYDRVRELEEWEELMFGDEE